MPGAAEPSRRDDGIRGRLVLLLAIVTGAAAANLYYAQPLLHTLARAFGVSGATAGLLVTISQIGYVLGLAFLVPLGDLLERRSADLRDAARRRGRPGGRRRRPELHRVRADADDRRDRVGRRPGDRPDGVLARRRVRARPGRRQRDERPVDRDPARADRERVGGRRVRLADRVRRRRGGDAAARGDPLAGAAGRRADRGAPIRTAPRVGRVADSRGARAAPADGPRCGRLRMLQRPVDLARVPALRPALRLRQRGDRSVRPGRPGGGDDRARSPAGWPTAAAADSRRRWRS